MSTRGVDRRALRAALVARYPWLERTDIGPRAVESGECDRCGAEARLVETCGPVAWQFVGRRCAASEGLELWCDGHGEDGAAALAWLRALPAEADAAARLWWVATGEVALDPAFVTRAADRLGIPAGDLDGAGR